MEEGLKALTFPNVCSIQLIFNMFRQRPQEMLFSEAKRHNVGLIVRVPLASQLESNLHAAELPAISEEQMRQVRAIHDERIRPLVHYGW